MIPFLICTIAVFIAAATVFIILNARKNKQINNLKENIESFIEGGEKAEYSTSDSNFARLQNAVAELENLLLLEKSNSESQAKSNADFVADISHQLKTPLAGLRLYCEMEHNTTPSSHTEKELVLISKMEKLIYNVLKLEKIRSDTYVMNFEETELSDLLLDLKAEFSALFPTKTITVKGGGTLRTDKSWLREALGNVIKNACEHTKADGKVDIIIEQAEKSVSMIIEDNGGGVPENELPMLFRRFHRTENASPDSAGIGLSITKAIVEKHHGTITAENSEKGLRVSMCFPIIDANLKL